MKLLLDENLSDRLVPALADLFPGSRHVKELGLMHSADDGLWEHAGKNGFVLLTKDKDFQQLCALRGAPPKVDGCASATARRRSWPSCFAGRSRCCATSPAMRRLPC